MKDYLLLFRGGEALRAEDQKDAAKWEAHMLKWRAWMEKLSAEGRFISGLPLGVDGTVLNGSKRAITDGPFTEGKEIVGGFFMIKANDQDDAVEFSKGCPILDHEGSVEVRELKEMTL